MVLWEFPDEIRKYFESHPRPGVHGHVATDEQYEFMVSKGGIEHSIETEVEDALIFGESSFLHASSIRKERFLAEPKPDQNIVIIRRLAIFKAGQAVGTVALVINKNAGSVNCNNKISLQ